MTERDASTAPRVALVTGAASGIGLATVRLLHERGSAIVAVDADAAALEELGTAFRAGRIRPLVADVRELAALSAAVRVAEREFGGLDAVVASAGIGLSAPLRDARVDDIERVLDVDLVGSLLTAKAAIPALERSRGVIVFVTSVVGARPQPGQVVYGAAKAAIESAVAGLATELGGAGIRVVGVAPGTIDTPMLAGALGALPAAERARLDRELAAASVLGRIGAADEVARVIAFLASSEASFVTGTTVVVDGGYLALKTSRIDPAP